MARPPICCEKAEVRMCLTCPRRAAPGRGELSVIEHRIAKKLGPPPPGPWKPVPGKALR